MTFTDDDLKRLKEWLRNPKFTHGDNLAPDTVKLGEALLARLEATTALVPFVKHACGMGDFTTFCECGLTEKLEAWRKAAGRD